MNFGLGPKRSIHQTKKEVDLLTVNTQHFDYETALQERGLQHPINLYSIPPSDKISLPEVEDMVAERIRLLRVFDTAPTHWSANDWSDTPNTVSIKSSLKAVKGSSGRSFYELANKATKENCEGRKRDLMSHFFIRLYCCRTEELRKWFIWHETKFLQFQLMDKANQAAIPHILRANGAPFSTISGSAAKTLIENYEFLKFKCLGKDPFFYQVPLLDALDAVRKRSCVLINGIAYVAESDMVFLIIRWWKDELQSAMASLNRRIPMLDEDDRLISITNGIFFDLVTKADHIKNQDVQQAGQRRVPPEMVDSLAVDSFPPCMRHLHDSLRKEHHLKHFGRLYYTLFLKTIGMNLDDCIEFFRQEFVQKVPVERFQKEYTYNIRYNYGQEGKKVSLTGFGCTKIINQNAPGPGDCHGCPFRHFDRPHLVSLMKRYGVPDDTSLQPILDSVEGKNYTGACTNYFKVRYPNYELRSEKSEIYHPNQFYAESRRALRGETTSRVREDGGDQPNRGDFDDNMDDQLMSLEITQTSGDTNQSQEPMEVQVGEKDVASEETDAL